MNTELTDKIKGEPDCTCGTIHSPAGNIPRVTTKLTFKDYLGEISCRFNSFRMNYKIEPGIYAVGSPHAESNVFVSANYKLSFNKLRSALDGMNAWILVIDTKGINVWCAAGEGTFGTEELIKRITEHKLDKVVSHRKIILPQLGAPGIRAHIIKEKTGFHVCYGPVRANDIIPYIEAGYKTTREMRTVKFGFTDRLVLTPMELSLVFQKYLIYVAAIAILFGVGRGGFSITNAITFGMPFIMLGLISVLSGGFVTPLLLPLIPSRSFAIKGWILGIIMTAIYVNSEFFVQRSMGITADILAYIFYPAASSYIFLQFTGATTFTNISGVKKEIKYAMPVYISVAVVSIILLAAVKLEQLEIL